MISDLGIVECRRGIDRYRARGQMNEEKAARAQELLAEMLEGFDVMALTESVLRRASQALPIELGTLDALHLAAALEWHDEDAKPPVLATHDAALGRAARLMGLRVIGDTT